MDFLPQVREFERGNIKLEDINIKESIVVIGGGDVAFDVARSATRLQMLKYGKADVKLTSLENEDALPASMDELIEGEVILNKVEEHKGQLSENMLENITFS